MAKIDKVQEVSLKMLKPYENNAKMHSKDQVAKIADSIEEFGFLSPVLIDEDYNIVAGHGRVMAAQKLGLDSVPCVFLSELDETHRKAYILADNRLGELAEWNMDLVNTELEALQELDFDISLTGFEIELDDVEEEPENTTNYEAERLINECWQEYAAEYLEQFEILQNKGYTFSGVSPAFAKIKFLEAKYYNKDYPRYCSLAFHPMQFVTNGDCFSAYDGLQKVKDGDIKAERLRFVTGEKINTLYTGSLSFGGARMPLDFPVVLARSLIKEFADHGRVLDPCHGWGGRCVGAMLEDIEEYVGCDPSEYQNEGVRKIADSFADYSRTKVNLILAPYENAEIEKNSFDFALTSPPYFDTEKYLGGQQSHSTYDSYEYWRDGFYKALIQKTYDALKKNCFFALQVGSQRYPLANDGIEIAKECGFEFVEKRSAGINNNFNQKEESHAECVIVLKKGGE